MEPLLSISYLGKSNLVFYSVLSNLHLKGPDQLRLWSFGCYQIIGHNELEVQNIRLLEIIISATSLKSR